LLILIKSDKSIERIISRDSITERMANNRLLSQNISDCADIIIENNGTLEALFLKTDEVLRKEIPHYE